MNWTVILVPASYRRTTRWAFMLSETGAVRAKAIGRLIGLHIIDRAIRNCNLDIRRENQWEEKAKSDLGVVNARLDEYKHLKTVEERLKATGAIIDKTQELIIKLGRLESIKKDYEAVNAEYMEAKARFLKLSKLKECEIYIKTCEISVKNMDRLLKAKSVSREIQLEVADLSLVLERTSKLLQSADNINDAVNKKNVLDRMERLKVIIDGLESDIKTAQVQLYKTKNIGRYEQVLISAGEKKEKVSKLVSILESLNDNRIKSAKQEKVLSLSAKIDRCVYVINLINRKAERLNKIDNEKRLLKDSSTRLNECEKYIEKIQRDASKYASEYAKILKDAGRCPMCGNDISGATISEILKHYEEAL
jgi:exonuclease SbcC